MSSKGNKDAETFAVVLGLKDVPGHFANRFERDELKRMLHIRNMTGLIQKTQDEDTIAITLSIFCANYLPSLVDKFLDPPPSPHLSQDLQDELLLNNAYFHMLWFIRRNVCPYYMKYLRSHRDAAAKNQVLPKGIVQRLLKVVPIWERLGYLKKAPEHWLAEPTDDNAPPAQSLALLQNILTTYIKRSDKEEILPTELRKGLEWRIAKWHDWHEGTRLAEICKFFGLILQAEGEGWVRVARTLIYGLFSGWHACANWPCKKTEEQGLKACSRCQTVKYCSPAHQKEHWNKGHKYRCFSTTY